MDSLRNLARRLTGVGANDDSVLVERAIEQMERFQLVVSIIEKLALWNCDESADVDNASPDDQVAHVNGLIVQACRKAMSDGIEAGGKTDG